MNKLAFLERIASRKVTKEVERATKKSKVTDPETIRKLSVTTIKMLNWHPKYTAEKARSNFLKDNGLPADIRKLRKKSGWSDNDIVEFYWSVEKFRELWCDVLGMDKDNWIFCVETMSRDKNWDKQ